MNYEYGIKHRVDKLSNYEQHRVHMTEDEARYWLHLWINDDGEPGAFQVIRRPIGPWEEAP